MFSFCIGFKGWHLDHLDRCLYWIDRLLTEDDEIIVCDLGSKVDTVREVLALVQPYWGTRSGKLFVSAWAADWSRAEALNRAAAQARQPWLIFVDADTLLPRCWMPAITADVFADPESPVRLTRSRDLPDFGPHPFPIPGALDDAWLYALTTEHPETGQGAATVVRRDWFIRVGGFDEIYRTWGCLNAEARVVLADGRHMKISEIVNRRLHVLVKSLNVATGTIEAKPITNWWRALGPKGQPWLRVILQKGGKAKQGRQGVVLTPDHLMLTSDGKWRRTDELAPGMLVALADPLLTPRQREMILGSTLGDGSIVSRNRTGRAGFAVSHVQSQWPYLRLKAGLLGDLLGAEIIEDRRGTHQPIKKTTSRYTRELETLRALCYPDGIKRVSCEWLSQVGPFGLAIYFLDDGFLQGRSASICSKISFGLAGAMLIVERLRELGVESVVDEKRRGTFVIRLRQDATRAFMRLIGKYVPPAMRYKVTEDAEPFNPTTWDLEKESPRPTWTEIEGVEVYRSCLGIPSRARYCLTVADNGNFFTPSGLVKNCEDNDLVLRAEWDTGHPVRWVPGAWAAHQWHSRAWGNTPEVAEQVRKNREYLAARIAERGPIIRNQHLTRGSHGDHTAR